MTGSGMEINLSKNCFTDVVKRKSATWHWGTRDKPNLVKKVDVDSKESSILGIRSKDYARFELLNLSSFCKKKLLFFNHDGKSFRSGVNYAIF